MKAKKIAQKALCVLLICSQVLLGGVVAYAYDGGEPGGNPPSRTRNICDDRPR